MAALSLGSAQSASVALGILANWAGEPAGQPRSLVHFPLSQVYLSAPLSLAHPVAASAYKTSTTMAVMNSGVVLHRPSSFPPPLVGFPSVRAIPLPAHAVREL